MKLSTSAVALAALFLATPALAQDEDTSMSGFYVGGYVGYDHVTISVEGEGDGSKDGVAFGALAGYNVDLGGAFVGIEGEIGDASTQQEEQDLILLGDEAVLSANLDLFIGGRIGVKASDKVAVYAKAGYARTTVKLAYDDNDGFAFAESDELDGLRIGGGIEYAINNRISLRGEYRYTDYSNYKYEGEDTGIGANRHQVLFGVVGKF